MRPNLRLSNFRLKQNEREKLDRQWQISFASLQRPVEKDKVSIDGQEK